MDLMVTHTQPAKPQTLNAVGQIGRTSGPTGSFRSASTIGDHQHAVYQASDSEPHSPSGEEMSPYGPSHTTQMDYGDLLYAGGTIENLATMGWHNASPRGQNRLTAQRRGSQA